MRVSTWVEGEGGGRGREREGDRGEEEGGDKRDFKGEGWGRKDRGE